MCTLESLNILRASNFPARIATGVNSGRSLSNTDTQTQDNITNYLISVELWVQYSSNLRSAYQGHYDVPHVATGLGQRSFAVAGPKAWNSLPSELRCIFLLSTLPLGIVWRRSCSLGLMAFLLTFSSGVSRHGLAGAVRPFGRRLGWRRCPTSQLVYLCHVFYP